MAAGRGAVCRTRSSGRQRRCGGGIHSPEPGATRCGGGRMPAGRRLLGPLPRMRPVRARCAGRLVPCREVLRKRSGGGARRRPSRRPQRVRVPARLRRRHVCRRVPAASARFVRVPPSGRRGTAGALVSSPSAALRPTRVFSTVVCSRPAYAATGHAVCRGEGGSRETKTGPSGSEGAVRRISAPPLHPYRPPSVSFPEEAVLGGLK